VQSVAKIDRISLSMTFSSERNEIDMLTLIAVKVGVNILGTSKESRDPLTRTPVYKYISLWLTA